MPGGTSRRRGCHFADTPLSIHIETPTNGRGGCGGMTELSPTAQAAHRGGLWIPGCAGVAGHAPRRDRCAFPRRNTSRPCCCAPGSWCWLAAAAAAAAAAHTHCTRTHPPPPCVWTLQGYNLGLSLVELGRHREAAAAFASALRVMAALPAAQRPPDRLATLHVAAAEALSRCAPLRICPSTALSALLQRAGCVWVCVAR